MPPDPTPVPASWREGPTEPAPGPTPTRPPTQTEVAAPTGFSAVLAAFVNSGRPARAFIVVLTGIMFTYLVALLHSPSLPVPVMAWAPAAFPGKAKPEWAAFYFTEKGVGASVVVPDVWQDEWQELAALVGSFELPSDAFEAGGRSDRGWKFRGWTRLPGPADALLQPFEAPRENASASAAVVVRTVADEELSYTLVNLTFSASEPGPEPGFSPPSYVVADACQPAELTPERPTCLRSLPYQVTLARQPFPGSAPVVRAALGPNGVFYSREKDKAVFRYHSFTGSQSADGLPTANPSGRLRPLLLVPLSGEGHAAAVLDVRYALTDTDVTLDASVYSLAASSGYLLRPPHFIPQGVGSEWSSQKLIQLTMPLQTEEDSLMDDPAQLHFLSRPAYAQTPESVTFIFLSHIFTIHTLPLSSPSATRFRATQQPLPSLDFILCTERLAVHGNWLLAVGEGGQLAVFRRAGTDEDYAEPGAGFWAPDSAGDDLGNYVPPAERPPDPAARAWADLERRRLERGWAAHAALRRLPGDTVPLGLLFVPASPGTRGEEHPRALLFTPTHVHLVALGPTAVLPPSAFFADHAAMVFGMSAVVAFFALGEMGWADGRQIVPFLVFVGWGGLMYSLMLG
ncbi:hypothetical protein DFJ74DRAFT_703431 [Hyaloraphidium curvatum]|nr:hypothetical protein DFJ74DRAFT_703431 [Hyaloraphidium curvatum]